MLGPATSPCGGRRGGTPCALGGRRHHSRALWRLAAECVGQGGDDRPYVLDLGLVTARDVNWQFPGRVALLPQPLQKRPHACAVSRGPHTDTVVMGRREKERRRPMQLHLSDRIAVGVDGPQHPYRIRRHVRNTLDNGPLCRSRRLPPHGLFGKCGCTEPKTLRDHGQVPGRQLAAVVAGVHDGLVAVKAPGQRHYDGNAGGRLGSCLGAKDAISEAKPAGVLERRHTHTPAGHPSKTVRDQEERIGGRKGHGNHICLLCEQAVHLARLKIPDTHSHVG